MIEGDVFVAFLSPCGRQQNIGNQPRITRITRIQKQIVSNPRNPCNPRLNTHREAKARFVLRLRYTSITIAPSPIKQRRKLTSPPIHGRFTATTTTNRPARSETAPRSFINERPTNCLLYTSDAADERSSVDLG